MEGVDNTTTILWCRVDRNVARSAKIRHLSQPGTEFIIQKPRIELFPRVFYMAILHLHLSCSHTRLPLEMSSEISDGVLAAWLRKNKSVKKKMVCNIEDEKTA